MYSIYVDVEVINWFCLDDEAAAVAAVVVGMIIAFDASDICINWRYNPSGEFAIYITR